MAFHKLKFSGFLLLSVVLTYSSLSFLLLAKSSWGRGECDEIPGTRRTRLSYRWRRDRCEGEIPYPTGPEFLVSLSAKGEWVGDLATIEIKRLSNSSSIDDIQIEARFRENKYLLDNFSVDANDQFTWPKSEILEPLEIQQNDLLARAWLSIDHYLPVIIGNMPDDGFDNYEFRFHSGDPAFNFNRIEIINQQTAQICRNFYALNLYPDEVGLLPPILWNGRCNDNTKAEEGIYKFSYSYVYVDDEAEWVQDSGEFLFDHDPDWLSD